MVTIYDIAKASGFAPATVSKALNNYSGVNDKTKTRILDTAKQLGYLPNAAARSLTTKRSYNIGVVIYIKDTVDLTHYLFIKILNQFKNVLEKYGYDITIISTSAGAVYRGTFRDHCRMRQVDGIFLFGDYTSPPIVEIMESDIPAVGFDYCGGKISGVTSDNYEKTLELTQWLLSMGHKKIHFFAGSDNFVTRRRIEGFKDAFLSLSLPFNASFVTETDYYSPEICYKKTKELISSGTDCTAIIYPDDYSAIGGINALKDSGYNIPDDMSVAAFDGIEFSQITDPPLTTVKQNTEELGNKIAMKLLELIENPDAKNEIIVSASTIIKTASCKKIN